MQYQNSFNCYTPMLTILLLLASYIWLALYYFAMTSTFFDLHCINTGITSNSPKIIETYSTLTLIHPYIACFKQCPPPKLDALLHNKVHNTVKMRKQVNRNHTGGWGALDSGGWGMYVYKYIVQLRGGGRFLAVAGVAHCSGLGEETLWSVKWAFSLLLWPVLVINWRVVFQR